MAHSYDQTLLQRMGFADPDRRNPAHDEACIQIATEPQRVLDAMKISSGISNLVCELEVPLQKGSGQYATTVGFIDALVTWDVDDDRCFARGMIIEVKIKVQSIGDLLRQMNLYREYKQSHQRKTAPRNVVIQDYVIWSLDSPDIRFDKLLAQQGYHLIAGPLP